MTKNWAYPQLKCRRKASVIFQNSGIHEFLLTIKKNRIYCSEIGDLEIPSFEDLNFSSLQGKPLIVKELAEVSDAKYLVVPIQTHKGKENGFYIYYNKKESNPSRRDSK